MRVIKADGDHVGVLTTSQALELAKSEGLDLVEISPDANPPVAKIIDYGKYRYQLQKKEKASKKKQHAVQMKEITMGPFTEEHDLDFKLKHATKFLNQSDRVKFTIRFFGRQIVHKDKGRELLEKIQERLEDLAGVDQGITMTGKRMSMILVPKAK